MMVTLAGAMSTAELGISLAEMIRQDKVQIISCTGANLEEDLFNLVAHSHYEMIANYRDLTPLDEQRLLERAEEFGSQEAVGEAQAFDAPAPLESEADWASDQLETDASVLADNLGTELDNAFDAERKLAPAERADVVVDFSKYRGKTLILYNDAPAAFPARVACYDYYTGSADLPITVYAICIGGNIA